MGGLKCLCKKLKKNPKDKSDKNKIEETSSVSSNRNCNCGWEIETGYAIASGLSILEAKRIFIIAVGVFAEWNVINFSGGFAPLVITIVSASIGTPASLATLFAIHKRRKSPCYPLLKNLLNYLLAVTLFCVILNGMIIASTILYLNTSPGSIARVFNESMNLYSEETWHKVIIDEFQFTFQCCGHTEYRDWLALDWQKVDYASRDEMSSHLRLSDERFRAMAVPYSCCKTRTIKPCFHMDLSMQNWESPASSSINEYGCSDVISHIVLRSAAVSCCVSIFLVMTQILLTFIMIRIVKRPFPSTCPSVCDCTSDKYSPLHPLLGLSTVKSFVSSSSRGSPSSRCETQKKKRSSRLTTISSCSSSESSPSPHMSLNSKSNNNNNDNNNNNSNNNNNKNRCSGNNNCGLSGAAKIRPSLHTEHRLPKKRSTFLKRKEVK